MNTASHKPSAEIVNAEMQEKTKENARSVNTDNSLAEATHYYAKGYTGLGEFMLRYALETAKSHNERILPEEIGYVMSGGKGTPPERKKSETKETQSMQGFAKNFRQELSQILAPFHEIKGIVEEMSDKLLTFVELLLSQQSSSPKSL